MRAALVKAIRDLRRRRLQAAVVFVTALLAVGTGAMALALVAQTRDPYQTAFTAQRGAHLQVVFDGRLARTMAAGTGAELGASAVGGPYASTSAQVQVRSHSLPLAVIGRDGPDGAVDRLRVTAGHWPAGPGEIALTRSFAELNRLSIGDRIKVVSVAAERRLTVAGLVSDVDQGGADVSNQSAWVLSSALPGLTAKGMSTYVMDYRFTGDPTNAQLQADVGRLRSSLPPGSVISSVNYLTVGTLYRITNQIVSGLLLAFSVVSLLAGVAIVLSLVIGIVISAYREIGIMKALGFTPLQVELVFVLQIVMPAAAGALVGLALGTLASQPLLAAGWQALELPSEAGSTPGLGAAVAVAALLVVAAAAFLASLRAGRLRPAAVISNASAPRGRSGRMLRRLAAGLGLPRPLVLGIGDAFTRPARTAVTLATIFLGAATVALALGVPRSFGTIVTASTTGLHADIVVHRSPALADQDAARIIAGGGQVRRIVGEHDENVGVPGLGDPATARMFRGDPAQVGFLLVSGRWYRGPGEAVAPRALIQATHLRFGDRFTVSFAGRPVRLVLVGESLDATSGGLSLFADLSTLAAVEPDAAPETYLVALRPGASADAYVGRVAAAQPDLLDVQKAEAATISVTQTIGDVLLILAAVMILIAVAGIFNMLLLNGRERVRDTAILKAIGMGPRQVMAMVTASAAVLALVAGALAMPAGLELDRLFLYILGTTAGGNDIPPAVYEVFAGWELVAIPLGSVVVAVAAALLPGRWAARTNVVAALHAE